MSFLPCIFERQPEVKKVSQISISIHGTISTKYYVF